MRTRYLWVLAAVAIGFPDVPAHASSILYSNLTVNGQLGAASRPDVPSGAEIEAADDFTLTSDSYITRASFIGLIPAGVPLTAIGEVAVEIYRVFPKDSTNPPDGRVPTRVNSPSDVAFDSRDSAANTLTFTPIVLGSFSVGNSVVNGIHPIPNQTTGGDGPAAGQEVQFDVTLATPFLLPADHYFFVPQVQLSSGVFLWLSALRPPVPGPNPNPDLQAWIRNADLDPDWLRIGTDIIGGSPAPTFNLAFALQGDPVPEPASIVLLSAGLLAVARSVRRRTRR